MARARPGQPMVIDLTDTPSGGNTTVARAMLGWFVDRPTLYQVHNLPVEERRTGIARQWVEQVLPRAGQTHRGPVTVRVGRWTGSMGEGLAIAFDAHRRPGRGQPMAGLLGAIYDHRSTVGPGHQAPDRAALSRSTARRVRSSCPRPCAGAWINFGI